MKYKSLLAASMLILTAIPGLSFGSEPSGKGVIHRMVTFANYGNGDVFVSMPTNGEICTYGYYLNKDSAGYNSIMSMLLAAYQAQTSIIITANENKRWSGSSNPVCEIYSVEYKR